MPLTLQSLLKARRLQKLDVPEFGEGVSVWVRGMTVAERDAFCLACNEAKGDFAKVTAARNAMVAACLVDEAGQAICASPDEAQQLDGAAVEKIAKAIQFLSGFGDDGEKKALPTIQSGPSASA